MHNGEGNMAEAVVRWLQGGIFVGTDSTKHSVVLSTQGEGGGIGMKPSELLLISLASCTAVDVVKILEKRRTPVKRLEIVATGEQDGDPPWQFKHIQLTYRLKGEGITEEAVQKAIDLSEGKYCSVSASLKGQVDIGYDFEILDGSD
jgi:putative redox protein